MKKIVPFLLLSICSFSSKAQSFVLPDVNWQQSIPNLMGGNCVEISNVSYSGMNSAYSYYNTGGAIGLTEGVLMTSGRAIDAVGPNNTVGVGLDNHSTTTAPIAIRQHLANSIGISPEMMYNTAFIRFNFRVSDTMDVFINYVFASEEYNEYVNTEFNDVFGFYVQGPGVPNGIMNIAKIPNSQSSVSINNLNNGYSSAGAANGPCTNCDYFIDNTGGSYLQYDGYTTPLTANFSPIPDSLYTITILISDVSDGLWDCGVFLNVATGSADFNGNVTHEGNPLSAGDVQLFGYNLDSLEGPLVATVPLESDGSYTFSNVDYGGYLLRYIPNPLLYPTLSPTYVDSVHAWNDARIVTLPCDLEVGTIHAKNLAQTSPGNGYVSGEVAQVYDDNVQVKIHEKSNVLMMLMDMTGSPAAWTMTDADGHYEFKNVPNGIFLVYPEIPLVNNLSPVKVVNGDNDSTTSVNFGVHNNVAEHVNEWVPYALATMDDLYRIYPNPSSGVFQLFMNGTGWSADGKATLQIFDMASVKKTITLSLPTDEQHSLQFIPISTEELSDGVYVMCISTANKKEYIKFIIAK